MYRKLQFDSRVNSELWPSKIIITQALTNCGMKDEVWQETTLETNVSGKSAGLTGSIAVLPVDFREQTGLWEYLKFLGKSDEQYIAPFLAHAIFLRFAYKCVSQIDQPCKPSPCLLGPKSDVIFRRSCAKFLGLAAICEIPQTSSVKSIVQRLCRLVHPEVP